MAPALQAVAIGTAKPKRTAAKRQRQFIVERRGKYARWFGVDKAWNVLAVENRLDPARHRADDAQRGVSSLFYDFRVRRSDLRIERVK